jgi:DNA-binding NarL/FixJ family response regulator
MQVTVGLVDDHQLFLKSLALMLESFKNYDVIVEASNGKELQTKLLSAKALPDIMLIDLTMPIMDGIETAKWLNATFPSIKLVALSMNDNDNAVIAMIKAGCCAYLLKDTHPNEFEKALASICTKGYYNGDISNINYRRLLLNENENNSVVFTDREQAFLKLASSDLTYKQIAVMMQVSERTVDSFREILFHKLNVQSRVGMVMEALRRNLITL